MAEDLSRRGKGRGLLCDGFCVEVEIVRSEEDKEVVPATCGASEGPERRSGALTRSSSDNLAKRQPTYRLRWPPIGLSHGPRTATIHQTAGTRIQTGT